MSRLAAVGTIWNAARSEPARDGAGESRHADDRGREEGGVAAAETDGADDPFLPAGAVRGHPRSDRDQSRGDAVSDASSPDALRPRITLISRGITRCRTKRERDERQPLGPNARPGGGEERPRQR